MERENIFCDELLKSYGAKLVELSKGEMLFAQGDPAQYFFCVRSGRIKMSHFNEQGREFIQGYFSMGESFGEPPFFARLAYPSSAFATEASEVWQMSYCNFMTMLHEHAEMAVKLLRALSERLIYKSIMLRETAIEEAEHRLLTLLTHLKKEHGIPAEKEYLIKLTRQELADMTGLRVETVIRTIKHLEQKHLVEITGGKIFLLPKKHQLAGRQSKELLKEYL